MGQGAFVDRYDRPNHKLHIIVFITIVAISVFLATQVEKTKEKTDIAALKNPIPIDSVEIDNKSSVQDNVPSVKSPVINQNIASSSEAEQVDYTSPTQEYVFDEQPVLDNINDSLATKEAIVDGESSTNITPAQTNSDVAQSETDLNADPALDLMDQAYQQQQDRFLETLAKSAHLETQESIDIKKIKEAIRSDKPLDPMKKKSTATTVAKAEAKKKSIDKSKTIQKPLQITKQEKTASNQTKVLKLAADKKQDVQPASFITKSTIAKSNTVEMPVMTKEELNKVVSQFAHSYNQGDINRLMSLFADNASTNDRYNKTGIKADYAELFNNTQTRKLMIKDVKWRLVKDKAEGAADFVVTVRPKNSVESNFYQGYIKITAIKKFKDVYITSLIHELKK